MQKLQHIFLRASKGKVISLKNDQKNVHYEIVRNEDKLREVEEQVLVR